MVGKKINQREELLDKLTKRVLDLDLKRSLGEDINLREVALDHINALDEITSIDKSEIEQIANQIIKEYQEKQTTSQKFHGFLSKNRKELLIFLIATLFALVIFFGILLLNSSKSNDINVPPSAGLTQTSETNRVYYVRAMLAQVVSQMTGAKMLFTEFYMVTGKMPSKFEDMEYALLDLQDSNLIKKANITKSGELVVLLSDDFGENKVVKLVSSTNRSGTNIKWVCETNLEPKFLGISQTAFCKYNQDL